MADLRHETAAELVSAIEAAGGRALAVTTDVTKAEDTDVAAAAVDAFGGVDVLVNNAGILRSTKIVDITPEEWDLVMAST